MPGIKGPQNKKRLTYLFMVLALVMLAVILRLFWIQVVRSGFYQQQAISQRSLKLRIEPKRGNIYDRYGERLAVSASTDTVVAIPVEIQNPEHTARRLAGVLNMDQQEIYRRITSRLAAVYLERKLDSERAQKIKTMHLPGIIFTEESKRFYPQQGLASHLLGFAGIDSQGLDGIEYSYDQLLKGEFGDLEAERDATGREIPFGYQSYNPPDDGSHLYLTIDNVIQFLIEKKLEAAMEEHEALSGTVVAMEPDTGRILALANHPAYDPNEFASYSPDRWRNVAISDNYEPGSTFKAFTAATALELGLVSEQDHFYDPGSIKVEGETIRCWQPGGHGSQSFVEIVQNSCNPAFVQLGQRIGREDYLDYIHDFGFGSPTGIPLPGEASGMLYSHQTLGPVELATMAYGHGVAVTPMQLITGMSVIANGGQLIQPQVVERIVSSEGDRIQEFEPQVVRRVISEETSRRMRDILYQVVEDGSGYRAQIDGYAIGGKTGTAQHYRDDIYDVSFVGFLPASDPSFIMLVVLRGLSSEPYYASQTVVPLYHEIVLDIIRYLDLQPQFPEKIEESEPEQREVPVVEKMRIIEAERTLREQGFNVKLEGEGRSVLQQFPHPGVMLPEGATVVLFSEGGVDRLNNYRLAVPDLKGMTLEEVEEILYPLGFHFNYQGEGKVVEQSLEAGELVRAGTELELKLE